MNEEIIYLDHAATTPVSEKVLAAMLPYFSEKFYNPSAPYVQALEVRRDYEDAKHLIAQNIGAKSDEIVMTAGATESINLAFSAASKENGDEILVGEFEHHAVLNSAEKYGVRKLIKIKKDSVIDLEDLRAKITSKTKIVSVMLANNETGVIQPISKIAEIIREERMRRLSNGEKTPIYLHSDASQGVGQIDISVARQTGLLWANREIKFSAQIVGGGQERNLRSGTENVPNVIGFAKAIQLAEKHRKKENERLRELKEIFKKILRDNFLEDEMIFLGNSKKQLASHISVSFPGIDAERMVFALEIQGVLVATGSACAANKGVRSHTLTAMGLTDGEADGSLRISLGKLSNEENTKRAAEIISKTIKAEFKRIQK